MAKKRILVLADLPGEGLDRLRSQCHVEVDPEGVRSERDLARRIPGFDGLLPLLTHRVGEEVFAAADRLRIVANFAVGVDNIDLEAARRRRVTVTHTPHVLTDDSADLTWALILAVSRKVVEADRYVRAGRFRGWQPGLMLGRSLTGLTLGVVGAGRIGRAVLERAPAFKVNSLYHSRRRLPSGAERELGTEYRSMEDLLKASDIVSLHVPLGEETLHLIGRRSLALMKNGAILINTSRGPVVDEDALVSALEQGSLGGAGLDVYEREPEVHPGLMKLENVVLLPHLGSATHGTRILMADACCEDLRKVLVAGERPARDLTTASL